MLGKISNALIRREADTYLAQGLHEEALHLFARCLDSSPSIGPEFKAALEGQIRQIEAERLGVAVEERQQLSPEHISIIRKGWCEEVSADDLRVCADSFLGMGFYADALLEYTRLIREGHSPHPIIGRMADCLARLHAPGELVERVDRTARELFQDAPAVFSFKLSLAEHMAKSRHIAHAASLGRHLAEGKVDSRRYQTRLRTLLKNLKSTQATPPASSLPEDPLARIASPPPVSTFQRIQRAFMSLTGKLRSLARRR
jgi:tetratricopeptide (TPR) repeat protein